MHLLRYGENGELSIAEFDEDTKPPYAILSHRWGAEADEVTFQDLAQNTGNEKSGYAKIRFCGEQARRDGLEYFWIDTCCINKTNKAEYSHAIKSMFRWYQKAVKCYVYLSDVSINKRKADEDDSEFAWEPAFRVSKWFTRGWTLQELLAPSVVEFFSHEDKLLGSKTSLAQKIHEITGIPKSAIQGERLHKFTVNERLSWMQYRHTTVGENRAYALLGLFDVHVAPFPGEGASGAFKRLLDEIEKQERCVRDVRLTDPRDDKKRIVETKGGLIEGSYAWVLEHPNFKQWRSDPQSRMLWIKGDPGKGKTMLLCGITDELEKSNTSNLSFFFCQGTDSHINNATAVLRGLLYLLYKQQPSLVAHLRKKYDQAGSHLFGDANAWIAVADAFTSMIIDPDLEETYLVIDALDECITDLPKLLDLIIHSSSLSNRVKWLLSSRNELHIEQKLVSISTQARLSLELKDNAAQVAHAVDVYIDKKLPCIYSLGDVILRSQVRDVLRQKANGTFLWVALVVQELEKPESWNPLTVVQDAPTGLTELYHRMVNRIQQHTERNSKICRFLLVIVTIAYRPLFLAELGSLCRLPGQDSVLVENTRRIVGMCGSFLTIRDNQVYLIHQSARDYLSHEERTAILDRKDKVHYDMFSRSLEMLSRTLKRDMYGLGVLGCSIQDVTVPADDPLGPIRYSCVHWMEHLYAAIVDKNTEYQKSLQDGGIVHRFIEARYLYWLEALSLCKNISVGLSVMARLQSLLQERVGAVVLKQLVHDAWRFVMYNKRGIEIAPIQAYVSALLFSPTESLVRNLFHHEMPEHISDGPAIRSSWSQCLQTLEGHRRRITLVACSTDSTRLASGSYDFTVKVWDVSNGNCLLTLKKHSDWVNSVAFSHDYGSAWLASGSSDRTINIWDSYSGKCLQTLYGHKDRILFVTFSDDRKMARLASSSSDHTIKIWDVSNGNCVQTVKTNNDELLNSVAFLPGSNRLVSVSFGSKDQFIRLWDLSQGNYFNTLENPCNWISPVAFTHDLAQLALVSSPDDINAIEIWDMNTVKQLRKFESLEDQVHSMAFSQDSLQLASGLSNGTIKLWDTTSGNCLQILESHNAFVASVAFFHSSTGLASGSGDGTIKIWDLSNKEVYQTSKAQSDEVDFMTSSQDLALLACRSNDSKIRIWSMRSGECVQILKVYCGKVTGMAFSHDSTLLACVFEDATIRTWNIDSGEYLQALKSHRYQPDALAFSYDSAQLASGSMPGAIEIWNLSAGHCLKILKTSGGIVYSIAFSRNPAQLASSSSLPEGCTIDIFDINSGKIIHKLKDHTQFVPSLAFSHDSALLASASFDKTVKIWDPNCGVCLQTYLTGEMFNSISFDFAGSYLHTSSGVIKLHDVLSRSKNLALKIPQYCGLGLSDDYEWITYKSKRLIWLPLEYRSWDYSTVLENTVGIAVESRPLWIFKVDLDAVLAMEAFDN